MAKPKESAWEDMKLDIKKLVAIIGIVVLLLNMILFALAKINALTFFIIIGGFGLISYIFFRKKK